MRSGKLEKETLADAEATKSGLSVEMQTHTESIFGGCVAHECDDAFCV